MGWLGEFKAPSPPDEHGWLITAIEKHLTGNPQSSAADQARTVLTRLRAMAATASAEWEKERKALPDESYGTGEPLEKLTVPVQWAGPAANGLRLGLAGLGKGDKWAFGSEHELEIYLRNDGNEPVKFSWTPRADEGLSLLLTDDEGATLRASIVMWSGLLFHNHCRLDPGHFLEAEAARGVQGPQNQCRRNEPRAGHRTERVSPREDRHLPLRGQLPHRPYGLGGQSGKQAVATCRRVGRGAEDAAGGSCRRRGGDSLSRFASLTGLQSSAHEFVSDECRIGDGDDDAAGG